MSKPTKLLYGLKRGMNSVTSNPMCPAQHMVWPCLLGWSGQVSGGNNTMEWW